MKRLFALSVLLALMAPAALPAQTVLLLSTGITALDTQTRGVLEAGGASVVVGSQYTTFTAAELTGIDVVLLFPNSNWESGDMSLAAQTSLVNFVGAGGGLVTAEWTNWKVGAGSLVNLDPILPVVSTTQYTFGSNLTYSQATANATLNAGLPASFTFPGDNFEGVESYFAAKPGASVFYTSTGGAAGAGLVGWEFGEGRVLQFSTTLGPLGLSDPHLSRLFQNSVQWSAVPEPSTYLLMLAGLGILLRFRIHRR